MKNILVIRFGSLGDTVLVTGVLKYLKQCRPDVSISVLTSIQYKEIFEDIDFIHKVYTINKQSNIFTLIKFSKTLPSFDGIFDLHNNLRSVCLRSFIRGKTFVYNKNSIARRLFVKFRICSKLLNKHTLEKYFSPFARSFNLPYTNIDALKPVLSILTKTVKQPKTIVIHPFASKKCKEWPYLSELCLKFINHGFHVVIIGAGDSSHLENIDNQTGVLPLEKLKEYIGAASLFITTDSGPLHIATALNVNILAIFGPTTRELGFYPTFKDVTVLENQNLLCRPCHIHGPNHCPKIHFQCMKAITADFVFNEALKKLKEKGL